MKIRTNISSFLSSDGKFLTRVAHLKAIRAQFGFSLVEAKAISDIVNKVVESGFTSPYLTIETTQYPQLDFMLRDERIKNYVNKPGDIIKFLDKLPIDTPEVKLLKATVNKLTKIGAYESAKIILDILYDINEEASEDA